MIRELHESDAEAYLTLRREALLGEPLAFLSSPDDDFAGSIIAIREHLGRAPEAVIFGAFRPGLVGSVGLYRDRHRKAWHKARLWGMYVAPDHRRQGLGGELLRAALRHAFRLPGVEQVHLGVSSAAPGARRLYEAAGFSLWGSEVDALRHAGRAATEHHMVLILERAARSWVQGA